MPTDFRKWMQDRRMPLAVGAVCAVLSLVMWERERRTWMAQAGAGAQREVVVVRRSVEAGARLAADDLERSGMPSRFVHPLAVAGAHAELVAGMPAVRKLTAGQPLLWSDVDDPNAGQTASLVRPLERAVVLKSAAGEEFVRASDHIDVFGTFDRGGGVVTVPVLQNVLVIAGGSGGLTVSVSPHEAALLTLAQETGRIAYVLRNRFDHDTAADLGQVSLDDLFEDGRRQAVQQTHNIRVLKGKL